MYAGWDFVLYALLLVAVVAWNLFTQALERRRRSRVLEQAAAQPAPAEPPPAPVEVGPRSFPSPEGWGKVPVPTSTEPWGRDTSGGPLPREPAAGVDWLPSPAPAREASRAPEASRVPRPARVHLDTVHAPRPPHPLRWRTRAQVRQAIVAMTILGPCRALAPWDAPGEPPR